MEMQNGIKVRTDPLKQSSVPKFLLAVVYWKQGNIEKAEKYLERKEAGMREKEIQRSKQLEKKIQMSNKANWENMKKEKSLQQRDI